MDIERKTEVFFDFWVPWSRNQCNY